MASCTIQMGWNIYWFSPTSISFWFFFFKWSTLYFYEKSEYIPIVATDWTSLSVVILSWSRHKSTTVVISFNFSRLRFWNYILFSNYRQSKIVFKTRMQKWPSTIILLDLEHIRTKISGPIKNRDPKMFQNLKTNNVKFEWAWLV